MVFFPTTDVQAALYKNIPKTYDIRVAQISEEHTYVDGDRVYPLSMSGSSETIQSIENVSGPSHPISETFDGDDDAYLFWTHHTPSGSNANTTVEHPIGDGWTVVTSGVPTGSQALMDTSRGSLEFPKYLIPASGSENISIVYQTNSYTVDTDCALSGSNIEFKHGTELARPSGNQFYHVDYYYNTQISADVRYADTDVEMEYPCITIKNMATYPDTHATIGRRMKISYDSDEKTTIRGEVPVLELALQVYTEDTDEADKDSLADGIAQQLLNWFLEDVQAVIDTYGGAIRDWGNIQNLNDIVADQYRGRRMFTIDIALPAYWEDAVKLVKTLDDISVSVEI